MSIRIQQPRPFDIVGSSVHIAGIAGGAFEANYNYVITEGHDGVSGYFMAGDGVGGHGQFQAIADISGAAFTHVVAHLEVFHTSPQDGSRMDLVMIPIILGSSIVPGYSTYVEYVVRSGDTLGKIAGEFYEDTGLYRRLVAANPSITNPNLIHPGDVIRVPRAL